MARLVDDIGGQPVNDGERHVIGMLVERLPDDYAVLPNIEVRQKRQLYEIDAIVLAPHAVYVIEVKDYRRPLEGDERMWRHGGREVRSPIKLTNEKARVLKDALKREDPGLGAAWVQPFVVLPRPHRRLELSDTARQDVLLLDEAIEALTDPGRLAGRARFVDDLVARAEAALTPVVRRRPGPRRFGSWQITTTLDDDGTVARYRAVSELAPNAPEKLLTVWRLSHYLLDDGERDDEVDRIVREVTALRHMGPDSGILAAHDAFEDEGQIVIVSEPPHGTTLDHLLRDGLDLTGAQRLSYLGQLVDAVGHAHASGVIHRRIRPGVIVIDGDRLRLGGFDHARIPAERTIHHDPASIDVDADGGYIAPEVLDPQVGPATAATDLFSVGAIAWSLWSGERLPGEWTARGEPLERPEGMPAGVWDVVATLLRVEPDARTATLDDLQDAIAHAGATSHDPRSPDEALPTAPAEYAVGSLIADRYEVREKLGAGTFSTVYRVFDPLAGLERAVKMLHPAYGIDRAQREVHPLEGLDHESVVSALHVDWTRTEPPQVYIVSELAPGVPLSALTSADEPLPTEEAVAIVDRLLDACEHFHPGPADGAEPGAPRGVVHRDIKPANVMYDRATGTVKLLDFNVASPSGADVHTRSGTPGYLPPDPHPDEWHPDVDLYAIGVVLYELLTGRRPHTGAGATPGPPVPPSAHRPDVPAALDRFCQRACHSRRTERFTTATEMRAALRDATSAPTPPPPPATRPPDGSPATVPPGAAVAVAPATAQLPLTTSATAPATGARWQVTQRQLGAGAVVLLVVVAVVALLVATRSDGTPDTTATEGSRPSPVEAAPLGPDCPTGYPVKGNHSRSGDLIYHEPGWRFYDQTTPERCFATSDAAEAAGFRASKVR